MLHLSSRSDPGAGPNVLAAAVAARRADRPLVDLTVGNPTVVDIDYPDAAITNALARAASVRYAPHPRGARGAREAIAALWAERGHQVEPDRVIVTASTSEGYSLLFKLLCDPGDEVLVPQPSYPLFEHLARLDGVIPRPYRLAYDGAWHIDFDSLRRARTARSRAIISVSPNNPTGSYVDRSELTRLTDLGIPLISDEVFAAYPLDPRADHATSALDASESLVFVLDGLSKLAGLPHLKLGWITVGGPASDVDRATERLDHVADAYLSASGPVQHALVDLLASSDVTRRSIREQIRNNVARLRQCTTGTAVTAFRVEGGWYAPVRLPNVLDEERWVIDLLERDVLVQPGWFYDFDLEPVVVLSLLTRPNDFEIGLNRLVERVSEAG